MSDPDIHIEIGNELTPDVQAGMRLFAGMTRRQSDTTGIQTWPYWIEKNPYGKAVYAVAKHGAEVVGFYALLPVEMRLEDRPVRGAKGEFFVVASEYRGAVHGPSAMRLPLALSSELHKAAAKFGIDCIFLISTPAAAICHAITGAKTICYDFDQYAIPFRIADQEISGQTRLQQCRTFFVICYMAVRRILAAVRRLGVKRGKFEVVSSLGEMPELDGKNLLVNNSRRMLDFRFPASRYLTYSTQDVDGRRAFLVFNVPERGAAVQLKHWSTQKIPFENIATVLEDIGRRCRRAGARSLSVAIPSSEVDQFGPIEQLGFLHTRSTSSLQVFSGAMQIATDPACWRFTEIHTGFMSFE